MAQLFFDFSLRTLRLTTNNALVLLGGLRIELLR